MATTPNYDINYDDKRLTDVKAQEQTALTENEQLYGGMVDNVDQYYQDLQQQSKDYADKQAQLQQDNTDFAIEQINQQKEQAQKDYTKEQSGAYVDWQKQSNQYGAQAEQMASQGMAGSGYSESSNVSMYNTYQNRVAVARESLNKTMMNFDNNIQQAILQNNSALAEIYYNAHREQLELSLEGFQYKNTLLIEQANKQQELKQFYSNEYQNVLNQMNTENALAENVRQFNEDQELKREELAQGQARWEEEQRVKQDNWQKEYDLAKDEAERKALLEEREMQIKEAEEKRNAEIYSIEKKYGNSGGSGGSGGNGGNSAIDKQDNVTNSSYWNGERAKDVGGYGYFSNGYQPKGVEINGKAYKLESTGKKFAKTNTTLWGTQETKEITVWKAGGKYFYWNGPSNSYVEMSDTDLKKAGVKK